LTFPKTLSIFYLVTSEAEATVLIDILLSAVTAGTAEGVDVLGLVVIGASSSSSANAESILVGD